MAEPRVRASGRVLQQHPVLSKGAEHQETAAVELRQRGPPVTALNRIARQRPEVRVLR